MKLLVYGIKLSFPDEAANLLWSALQENNIN